MTELTDDAILKQLIDLPLRDMLTMCRVNRRYDNICDTPEFWRGRLLKEFPNIPKPIFDNIEDFRTFYLSQVLFDGDVYIFRKDEEGFTVDAKHITIPFSELSKYMDAMASKITKRRYEIFYAKETGSAIPLREYAYQSEPEEFKYFGLYPEDGMLTLEDIDVNKPDHVDIFIDFTKSFYNKVKEYKSPIWGYHENGNTLAYLRNVISQDRKRRQIMANTINNPSISRITFGEQRPSNKGNFVVSLPDLPQDERFEVKSNGLKARPTSIFSKLPNYNLTLEEITEKITSNIGRGTFELLKGNLGFDTYDEFQYLQINYLASLDEEQLNTIRLYLVDADYGRVRTIYIGHPDNPNRLHVHDENFAKGICFDIHGDIVILYKFE